MRLHVGLQHPIFGHYYDQSLKGTQEGAAPATSKFTFRYVRFRNRGRPVARGLSWSACEPFPNRGFIFAAAQPDPGPIPLVAICCFDGV